MILRILLLIPSRKLRVQGAATVGEDPGQLGFQVLCKGLEGLDSAADRSLVPLVEEPPDRPRVGVGPQVLEVALEHVDSGQTPVGIRQLAAPHPILWRDILLVPQEEPARPFDHFPRGPDPAACGYAC